MLLLSQEKKWSFFFFFSLIVFFELDLGEVEEEIKGASGSTTCCMVSNRNKFENIH